MDRNEYKSVLKFLQGELDVSHWNQDDILRIEKRAKEFRIQNGYLYRKKEDGSLLRVIQEDEVNTILFMMHDHPTGAHMGIDSTYGKIKERFFWDTMRKDVIKYVECCDTCQRRGKKGGKGRLNPIKVGRPFERIGLDFVGPLPRTKNGNKYILVASDYLTKWPEARAMRNATASNTIEFIYREIICRHGCPEVILTDRGSHFRNQLVEGLCEKFEIKHKLSSPYHPQTNGLVERFNRTLCESLAKVSKEENQWDRHIESVLFGYRTATQRTTRKTPFYLTYGREARLPIDKEMEERDFSELNEKGYQEVIHNRIFDIINLVEGRNEAMTNIERSQIKQKERYDGKIPKETEFRIGDKVLLKDSAKEKQWTGKLSPNWKGPYYIHEVIGRGAYRIKTMDGKILRGTQNVKNLKGYKDSRNLQDQIHV
jgi:hypothetical protein